MCICSEITLFIANAWSFLNNNWGGIITSITAPALFWQILTTRQHNKLSVKPHLQDHTHENNEPENTFIEYTLQNTGIGPAIIKKIHLEDKEEKLLISEPDQVMKHILDSLHKKYSSIYPKNK